MKLKDIRQEFVRQSGRYDLTDEDGANQGADFYIRAGQLWLDRASEQKRDFGRAFSLTEPGNYIVRFPLCRSIHEVWVFDLEKGHKLRKKSLSELKLQFQKPFEHVDQTLPQYFCPANFQLAGDAKPYFDAFSSRADIISSWQAYEGVILMPVPDRQYQVEIWGKFYSQKLESDEDVSFWSLHYPHILVMAAQRALEVFYRNTQGVQDWTMAIQSELLTLEHDHIEETTYTWDQMEG